MKPSQWLIPLLLATPAVVPIFSAVADNSRSSSASEQLLAALTPGQELTWVAIKSSVTVEELSSQLAIDESRLASLNKVDEDHRFDKGEWLALPTGNTDSLNLVAALDSNERRSSPPASVGHTPLTSSAVIRLGDTLAGLAGRYGLTEAQLKELNPGLESAPLMVGTQVRLAQAAPLPTLNPIGTFPVGSGGASWPDQPRFTDQQPGGAATFQSYIWPTEGVFTSGYGWRWGRMHRGIDVANNVGTPIKAVKDGQVSFAGWDDGGYGYLVKITHADGAVTIYGHNSRLMVQTGEIVRQGQVISLMGSTGRSTGPHLHFEVRPGGQSAVNPLQFLPPKA